MKVFFVYKSLAHPENNRYVTPFTLEERLLHVKEAKKTLGATVPWLVDTMDNDLKHALGDRPNSEFIIGPDGKIVVLRDWSRPDDLRAELEELVGTVENPTRVADLDLKIETTPRPAASGVVERPRLPGGLSPVQVEPQEGKHPFYVKLRAEVDQNVLRGRAGKMYLGFHLDPIYHVHWNNLAAPLSFQITAPDGVTISPASATGPKPEEEADIDPREFLVDVEAGNLDKPFELKVKYYACNDEKGFCIPVSQTYVVHLQRDRDGGSARRSSGNRSRPSFAENRPPENSPQRTSGLRSIVDRILSYDRNKDGKVTKDELPKFLADRFSRIDTSNDGAISKEEAEQLERRLRGNSGRSPNRDRRPPASPGRGDN